MRTTRPRPIEALATLALALLGCSAKDSPAPAAPSCALDQAKAIACPFAAKAEGFANDESKAICESGRLGMNEDLDAFGLPGELPVLAGRMQRGTSNYLVGKVYAGESVRLWVQSASGSWEPFGAPAKTDENGAYSFAVPPALQAKSAGGPIFARLDGDGSCAMHGVYAWSRGTKIVVTDIDGTLTKSNEEFTKQVTDANYVPAEHPSATATMKAWRRKGYRVVFLSARADAFRTPTRTWLRDKGVDFGPLITAKSIASGGDAVAYKTKALKRLVDDFGWSIVAAYGNEASDVEAYAAAGVPKEQTFTVENANGSAGTVGLAGDDYGPHITGYVEKRPDAQQP